MGKFTSKHLKEIEEHILRCKTSTAITMAEHNNDYTINKVVYRCKKCGVAVGSDVNRDKAVDYAMIGCPCCKDDQEILILNIRDN